MPDGSPLQQRLVGGHYIFLPALYVLLLLALVGGLDNTCWLDLYLSFIGLPLGLTANKPQSYFYEGKLEAS